MGNLRAGKVSRVAIDRLSTQGLNLPTSPQGSIPSLPNDITSLGDEDLMDLFVLFTSWSDFVGVQVACAQVDEKASQRALDLAEVSSYTRTAGGGGRVTDNKAKAASDPLVIEANKEFEEKYAYRKLIEALQASVERDAALISREITRRTSSTSNRRDRWTA